jgi:hypothetical protein
MSGLFTIIELDRLPKIPRDGLLIIAAGLELYSIMGSDEFYFDKALFFVLSTIFSEI